MVGLFVESLALWYACGSFNSTIDTHTSYRIENKRKQTKWANTRTPYTHIPLHTCSNKLPTLPKWREWILYQLKWNCKTLHWTSVDWAASSQLMAFNFIYFKDCCNYDRKKSRNRSVSMKMNCFFVWFCLFKKKIKEKIKEKIKWNKNKHLFIAPYSQLSFKRRQRQLKF